MYDVVIAGAGVTGGLLARELTRYRLSVCVLEKENDVATGASKANSGIIHGGFDPEPGTLKAKLNVEGVPLLYQAAKELHVPHRNNGSLVVAFSPEEKQTLQVLLARGEQNGVTGMQILSGDEARALEPNLSKDVFAALHIPSAGIICPYALTIAAIGNAMDNGAELLRNFEIVKMEKPDDAFLVTAADGRQVTARYFINCAGTFADRVAALAGDPSFSIIPRAGEYLLLDKTEGTTVSHTIFQVPTEKGKGVLVTPTADGNLLLGPTADPVDDPEGTATTAAGLDMVSALARKSVPNVNTRNVITSFAGVRASTKQGDFLIQNSEIVPGLVHAAAIDSPGLSSCVAIAKYVVNLLKESGLELIENPDFDGTREDVHAFRHMSDEEKDAYIQSHPAYGRIICRCETVSEGEIIDALHRNPAAWDVDGIKRRTRSGMGRCQGGFCSPYVMRLIEKETGRSMEEITKKGRGSQMVEGVL
ncbi:MAG: NAD(P)/FAD-dependent oxidoreductase [Clostridia bacterium]|nr:NAD(P)/FAD-dependent oxidoreductase [Clostridia bacterium]